MERPSISLILSFFKGRIVMINQYRYPIDETSLELPAGLIKPNETPEVCAKRELKEETGYYARNVEKIFSYFPSNSISNQQVNLCIASNLSKGKQQLEDDEIIDVILMDKSEVLDKISDGTITDGRTVLAILYASWLNRM